MRCPLSTRFVIVGGSVLLFTMLLPPWCYAIGQAHSAGNNGITPGSACGVERWAVKALMDPSSSSLPTVLTVTTVDALISIMAPRDATLLTRRVPPVKTTLWTLRALLVGYRLESDSDFHLVLADPSDPPHTMIGEIPAAFCTDSSKAAAFARAREGVVAIERHTVPIERADMSKRTGAGSIIGVRIRP